MLNNTVDFEEKQMNKKKATAELQKIYKVIEEDDIRFKIDRNISYDAIGHVSIDYFNRVVVSISPYGKPHFPKYNFIETIIHEILHIIYYKKKEPEIELLGQLIFKHLTDRQMQNLLIKVTKRFI